MSQAGILDVSAAVLPPDVPLDFTTDAQDLSVGAVAAPLGSVTPQLNILRVIGGNGIQTIETSVAGNLLVRFIRTQLTTSGAVTDFFEISLSVGVVTYNLILSALGSNAEGIGMYGNFVAKKILGVASVVGTVDILIQKDTNMVAADVTITAVGDKIRVNVLGVAGVDITWNLCFPGIIGALP